MHAALVAPAELGRDGVTAEQRIDGVRHVRVHRHAIAVLDLLDRNQIRYDEANSAELNALDPAALRQQRLILVPGGNFIEMGAALTPQATANVRAAVRDGVNYLGICAGGFLAGKVGGHNSFDLTDGVRFGFYALSSKGVRSVMPSRRRAAA